MCKNVEKFVKVDKYFTKMGNEGKKFGQKSQKNIKSQVKIHLKYKGNR